MLSDGDKIDLSYNSFTFDKSSTPNCQPKQINLFRSYSEDNSSGITTCLSFIKCPKILYSSFHINCGGSQELVDGKTYEADTESGAPSKFFRSGTNWAFSSTGHFLDDDKPVDSYISPKTSSISTDNPLYMDARLSPLSLTYYGFCLQNGNYDVRLHFAEIRFTDDKTFSSLGRRIFDVYIQGKLELEDFNIEDQAGGVGKEINRTFTAIVTNGTLEIQFYWARKGTTGIPHRGVYGPLVSAIDVEPKFVPESENGKGLSAGSVVGIVAAVAFVIFTVLGILWWKGCVTRRYTRTSGNFEANCKDFGEE